MKKMIISTMILMLTVFASAVMADENGGEKAGRLYLFQKCDETLINQTVNEVIYDSSGCPQGNQGPWPVFPDKRKWGKMDYSLWGLKFNFSFEGKRLEPKKNYTLIYYPDDWPGTGLICLGSGTSSKAGKIKIKGNNDISTSLPADGDKNFNPVSPSGAVGAKIWLVLSDDVQCNNGSSMMTKWNPAAYLFEYNLIIYERREMDIDEEFEED